MRIVSSFYYAYIYTITTNVTAVSIPPEIGLDFLSKLDCFHPSSMANTAWSIGLWNNMLTPAGQKQTNLDLNNLQYKCPDANTFLQ